MRFTDVELSGPVTASQPCPRLVHPTKSRRNSHSQLPGYLRSTRGAVDRDPRERDRSAGTLNVRVPTCYVCNSFHASNGWNFGTLFRQSARVAAAARPDWSSFPFFNVVVVVVAVLTLTALRLIIDEERPRIADFRVFPHPYRRGPRLSLKIKSLGSSRRGLEV